MKRGIKITLLSLAAGGLIAVLVFVVFLFYDQPFYSPPDEPREWARQQYVETFWSSLAPGGLPTLSATAPVSISVTRRTGRVKVETIGLATDSIRTFYEVFTAGAGGKIVLPAGNRLRLEAVGIVMPEDVAGEEDPEGAITDIAWHDPATLAPLPPDQTKGWESRRWSAGRKPKLFIRVANEGGEPVRWHGAEVFDDRTLIQAQSGSSYYSHEKDGQFGMDLEIWHQTPLRIAFNFSFGEPEIQDLELKKDAELRFGDDALVRVIEVTSGRIQSTGWTSSPEGGLLKRAASFRYSLVKPGQGPWAHERGVVFHVWPAHNEKLIDFVVEEKKSGGKKRYLNAWGNDGITQADFPLESELVSVQARRMPRLGRAVFLLPKVPRLPETDNLFETPITRVELHYDNDMAEIIRKGAAVQWNAYSGRSVSKSVFPMTLKETTPAEVLRLNEELMERPVFFDRKKLEVTATKKGKLTDLKEWWKRNKPSWWR